MSTIEKIALSSLVIALLTLLGFKEFFVRVNPLVPVLPAPVQPAPVQPEPVQPAPPTPAVSTLDGTWYLRVKTLDNPGSMVMKGKLIFHGPNVDMMEGDATARAKWTLTGNILTLRMESTGDPELDTLLDDPLMSGLWPTHGMPLTRKNEDLFESGPLPGDRSSFKFELFRSRR
jgi:hypothetical protein